MSLRPSLRASLVSGALCCALSAVLLLQAVSKVRADREFLHLVRALEQELDLLALDTLRGEPVPGQSGFGFATLRPPRPSAQDLALKVDQQAPNAQPGELFSPPLEALLGIIAEYKQRPVSERSRSYLPGPISEGLERLRGQAHATLQRADDAMDQAQDRLFLLSATLPSCMVLLLVFLALRLRGRVLKPARVLQQAMEELRHGSWPAELQTRGLQELGGVTRSFNAMAQDKRQLEEALLAVQEELEARVERRTRELEEANHSLAEEVAERRLTEEQLRSSEQRFRRMFEVGPIGIAIFSKAGVLLEANSRLEELVGGEGRLSGRRLDEFCDPARAAELAAELRAALAAGAESFTGEVVLRGLDGETLLVNFVASAVRAKSGEVDYGLLMVRDISERRRAEERLLENERYAAMGRMAARIAHEINNPLAGIKNAFRLIKPAVPLDHPYARYVPRIDHEIDRVAGIVRQMYELYRPSSESQAEFWIDEAISDVVSLLRVANPTSLIELDVSGARVRTRLASGPIRQVLYNLIQNGMEHSPAGAPVRVSASVAQDELLLVVEDQGEGIFPEHHSRIFDSFFSTKEGRSSSGLGLGLAITHSAVGAMGGEVTFESQVGVGTRFRVTIPLESGRPESLTSSSALASLPS